MTQLTDEDRALIDVIIERAEQACRYVVKHRDGSWEDEDGQYREGFETAAEICERAIRGHVERHIEKDLSAARTQSQGGGWVLMPVEPTEAMVKAADRSGLVSEGYNGSLAEAVKALWSAMLAAAPPASQTEG